MTALDVEPIAVETAGANAERVLGPRWSDRYIAQLMSFEDFTVAANQPLFDLVVSNPPYIPKADMEQLDKTVLHESQVALFGGGADGMDTIRAIVRKLPEWCRPGAACWMEVDPTHPEKLREWLDGNATLAVAFVGSYTDMFGSDRFVQLVVKPNYSLSVEESFKKN